ncbi:MAG: choice-of-anchor L domain-containing protein [Bacteroidia bacterium]
MKKDLNLSYIPRAMTTSIRSIFLISLLMLLGVIQSHAQLTVNGAPTPAQLVTNTLIGTGVSITNVTFSGAATQRGTFNCAGACNIGIASGVILNSGSNANAIGPNNTTGQGTDTQAGSDPDLNALHPTGTNPQDAAVLEFNFRPASDSMRFRYVWGSEEYSDYVNSSCNDYFGFFISGLGIVGKKNIAVVPNTTTAISINTVNNGNAPGGTSPSGPCTNCAYFRDNTGSVTTQYDGLTTVLTAGTKVCPCQDYHMKLAVQDFCDGAFDSGVFLEANSFSSTGFNQVPIFANGNQYFLGDTIFICPGDSVKIYLDLINGCDAFWSTGDTAQYIWVNAPGTYNAYFLNINPYCFASTPSIKVAYTPNNFTIAANGPVSFCPGDSVVLTANGGASYLWSNGATTQSITVFNPGTFYCIVNPGQSCSDTTNLITVSHLAGSTVNITASGTLNLCPGQTVTLTSSTPSVQWSTGSTSQSITVNTAGTYTATPTAAGFCPNPASVTVTQATSPSVSISGNTNICQGATTNLSASLAMSSYLWSGGQTTSSITTGTAGTYTVTVTNAAGCTASTSTLLNVNPTPTVAVSGDFDFCLGSSSNISATAGYSQYLWSNGANTASTNVSLPGSYTVTVTSAAGCTNTATQAITVYNNPLPFINGVTAICQGANANLQANPSGLQYIWSNGSTSSSIQPGTSGNYTVTVTDGNGCTGSATQNVTVNNNPTPSITGPASVCTGLSGTLDAGAGYSSYQWSNGATTATTSVNTSGTYTVTVTNASGCTGTTTAVFTVLPFTTPVISAPAGFCAGNAATLSLNTAYAAYQWNSGASSSTLNVTNGGAYTVTVTAANGCTGTASYAITQWSLPAAQITGTTAVCSGNAANLQAAPAGLSYSWSNGSNASSIQPATGGNYTVTVTDGNGCSNTATQLVTINSNPAPAITGNFVVCQGIAGQLNASTAPGYNYSWSNGAITASIQPSTAGTYTVTVTDANGCSGTASQLLTVNALPVPSITGNTGFCTGNSVTLTCNTGYQNYQWSNGNTGNSTTINAGGSYQVTVTDNNGCTGTTSFPVTQWSLPNAQITGITAVCDGNAASLQALPAGLSYSWSNGSTAAGIQPTLAGSFTVTVTDGNGCSNSATQQVTINSNPTPAITGTFIVCQGNAGQLNASSGTGYTYNWSNGASSASIQPTAAGMYTVTVTDANGCTGTTSQQLTVNTLPAPVISGNNGFCTGNSVTLSCNPGYQNYIWSNGATAVSNTISSGGNYQVTVTDNNGCTGVASYTVTQFSLPQVILPAQVDICDGASSVLNPGTFTAYTWSNGSTGSSLQVSATGTYTVTVTDQHGCTGTGSTAVQVHNNPTPAIQGDHEICDGENTILNVPGVFTAYSWSPGSNATVLPVTTAGTYTVIVTDAYGCTGSAIFDVTVHPRPAVSITGDLSICEGEQTTLQVISDPATYQWSTGASTVSITTGSGGQYAVTATNSFGCTKIATTVVDRHAKPDVSYNPVHQISCDELRVKFDNTSTLDPGSKFLWRFGDGGISAERSPSHVYPAPGDYNTALRITSPYGCIDSSSATVSLVIPPYPEAEYSQSARIVSVFNSEVSFSNKSKNAVHYKWSFGDGESSVDENPKHIFEQVGTVKIKLHAFNEAECRDEFETTLEVVPFFVPSAFTPNNDGKNDVFFDGVPYMNLTSFDMKVFNRWGQVIYQTDSFLRPWDGLLSNGDPAPEGLYSYMIKIVSIKGKYFEYPGTFSLIR